MSNEVKRWWIDLRPHSKARAQGFSNRHSAWSKPFVRYGVECLCVMPVVEHQEIVEKLEAQLKEANEALSWYADEKNWRTPAMSTNCATDIQFMQFDDIEKVEMKNKGHWRRVAGQRARAYLKKWEEK